LYNSVPYDSAELRDIRKGIDASLLSSSIGKDSIISCLEIQSAIAKLKAHKGDGNIGLSSDHFIHAGADLAVHIAILFTSLIVHGSVPSDFLVSTIIPIPKNRHASAANSDNFRGIALSSVYCKLFDHVVLCKYHDKLISSDLQFGFKQNSSTSMCTMVLKETISYYVKNNTPVFCTFLDASKAFDRVNYVKLFRLLVDRGLPAGIIRILINMYLGQSIRVSWAGVVSSCFDVSNGVKQGGVSSPIYFCIYIDSLLSRLAKSGVGCYVGFMFVGAIAYADDIVLVAPTASAMRKMLVICDDFASEFDLLFNAQKSKFLVVVPGSRRNMLNEFNQCIFFVNGRQIENVNSFVHLGHVITSQFSDFEDIAQRRNCFVGQVNNLFCFFNKLSLDVRLKLFKAYCTSLYGCELWSLQSSSIDLFSTAWRKALRRLLRLPNDAHSYLLPILTDTLPVFVEICKRSARFIYSCLFSASSFVQKFVRYCITDAKYNSIIGANALYLCNFFNWTLSNFMLGSVGLQHHIFMDFCCDQVSQAQAQNAFFLAELISVREGNMILGNGVEGINSQSVISTNVFFNSSELDTVIRFVSCD
jgi:hypothetical protein